MIATLITLLVVLLILFVVWYIVRFAATTFGFPNGVVEIIGMILGLIFLLYALRLFGALPPINHWSP